MMCGEMIFVRKSLFIVMTSVSMQVMAFTPDCARSDAWPASMAFAFLKNEKLLNGDTTDFPKTTVSRIASEKIAKDLYRQVHLVKYVKNDGGHILTITVNEASSQECSMSGVDVYIVEKKIGEYTK